MTTEARAARLCLALALLALAWAVFASAWLSDDAWITLRSVDNLLAGHGLQEARHVVPEQRPAPLCARCHYHPA